MKPQANPGEAAERRARRRARLRARLLPAPALSALLFVAWPMLAGSLAVGQLLLAGLFALVLPWIVERTRGDYPQPRIGAPLLRLIAVVALDVVRANVEVARRVLGSEAAIRSRFVRVPLALDHPHAIVALAAIVTTTPGTISCGLSADRRTLLVHALHCDDEAALVQQIKARYEAPLAQIFR